MVEDPVARLARSPLLAFVGLIAPDINLNLGFRRAF